MRAPSIVFAQRVLGMSTLESFSGWDRAATGRPGAKKGVAATKVMVNGPDDAFVEEGRIERVRDRPFEGEESNRAPHRTHRGSRGPPGRSRVAMGGRSAPRWFQGADQISSNPFVVAGRFTLTEASPAPVQGAETGNRRSG